MDVLLQYVVHIFAILTISLSLAEVLSFNMKPVLLHGMREGREEGEGRMGEETLQNSQILKHG